VVLKQSEEDALEECLLVMKPCDSADMDDDCLDEEVRHHIHMHQRHYPRHLMNPPRLRWATNLIGD